MAKWCLIFVVALAFVHVITARNVPVDHARNDQQVLVHANAPAVAEPPSGLKDKKNFIYGGVGGFVGMGGYAGVVGGLPVLGGAGGIGKFGGIGGGIGGLGTGGLGTGGLGGVVGGLGGGAGGAAGGGAAGGGKCIGGVICP